MSTRKSLLSGIAYIPSYQPKTPKPIPKLLENAAAWKKLIEGVGVHIETAKAKNKGKGVPKPFSIQIVDTSGGEPKTNKKDKSAAAEPDVGEKKEHQFYRQLEQKYHCAEHDKPCAVLSDGTHYHLTDNDLAKWAYLISNHRATAEQLPRNELKIDDAAPRQHTAKKAIARGGLAALDSSEPPVWIQQMLPLMGLAMGGVMRNNLNAAPFETPRSAAPPPETPGPSRQSARDLDPPSSGTKRSAAMTAPTMDMWLRSLDNDHEGRGRHNLQFYGYSLKFEDNGMYDLTDMENMDIDTLSLLIGAPRGVAARLIKYATEDLEKLTNAAKRARHA
ncbi:hypothetical protein B0H11DRAFT_1725074 [Mycena galericulata]|nr:hypothetical protein B0H11DRAFT_1725074 [Mycena galericulata]